jgi:hypothetical protein
LIFVRCSIYVDAMLIDLVVCRYIFLLMLRVLARGLFSFSIRTQQPPPKPITISMANLFKAGFFISYPLLRSEGTNLTSLRLQNCHSRSRSRSRRKQKLLRRPLTGTLCT